MTTRARRTIVSRSLLISTAMAPHTSSLELMHVDRGVDWHPPSTSKR